MVVVIVSGAVVLGIYLWAASWVNSKDVTFRFMLTISGAHAMATQRVARNVRLMGGRSCNGLLGGGGGILNSCQVILLMEVEIRQDVLREASTRGEVLGRLLCVNDEII